MVLSALREDAHVRAHAEGAVCCLSTGDRFAVQARAILLLERDQVAARVEDGDSERSEFASACLGEGDVDDEVGVGGKHSGPYHRR